MFVITQKPTQFPNDFQLDFCKPPSSVHVGLIGMLDLAERGWLTKGPMCSIHWTRDTSRCVDHTLYIIHHIHILRNLACISYIVHHTVYIVHCETSTRHIHTSAHEYYLDVKLREALQ